MNILEEANFLVNGARQSSYDHPLDNFTRIAKIWSVILDKEITPEQVGLCMVGMKVARESFTHKQDNLIDGAGYFYTIQLVKEEAERRGNKS
jgi:hypothetical protein